MAIQKYEVSLRGGFSDRNGIKPENKMLQFDSLDQRSRIAIVNVIRLLIFRIFDNNRLDDSVESSFWLLLLSEVYQQEIDYFHPYCVDRAKLLEIINSTIKYDDYDCVLTLLEYLTGLLVKCSCLLNDDNIQVIQAINGVLEREFVGYRYVGNYIVPITDDLEIAAVNEALDVPYKKVSEHLDKAIGFLSDRTRSDFENSIKESISAVEAICSILIGKGTTLTDALNTLKSRGITIHPALERAFVNLYGYTSDASGIRHAGQLDGENSTFAEAKFMLISCSAFINYIKTIIL